MKMAAGSWKDDHVGGLFSEQFIFVGAFGGNEQDGHDPAVQQRLGGETTQNAVGYAFTAARDASPLGAGSPSGPPTTRRASLTTPSTTCRRGCCGLRHGRGPLLHGHDHVTSPANDNGVLTLSGGVYTYTTPDGQTETFNSAGDETQWTSADGQQTLQYRYNGSNQLTGATAIDGGLATFSYSSGLLSTIQTPGGRTYTMAYSGANLTAVTDPDGGVDAFGYDAAHHATSETFGGLSNSWGYTAAGALDLETWGSSGSPGATTVNPVAAQALSAALPGPLLATQTDADGHTTGFQLDYQGRAAAVRRRRRRGRVDATRRPVTCWPRPTRWAAPPATPWTRTATSPSRPTPTAAPSATSTRAPSTRWSP